MTKSVNEREIVLAVLTEVTENGMYSHLILRDVLNKYQYLEKRERSFITRVTEGTLEHLIEIDYILDQFSKVKVRKMKPVIRNILRLSVYQLRYMDSVPDRAVCSEAVKLAARKGFAGLKGFVNGVLRSIARNDSGIRWPAERTEYLSVRYSCPEWIIRLWQESLDTETVETMLRDFQEEKPLTVRCCLAKITPEELMAKLRSDGVRAEIHPYLPYALVISDYDYLEALDSFREGLFYVQDVSSMLAGELADPRAGDYVIDICAAPGGKALHAAEKLLIKEKEQHIKEQHEDGREEEPEAPADRRKAGQVEARDLTEYKVGLIRENIARSGLDNISAVCMDASVYDEASAGRADVVIADLPCSGLGVLGKKTDLKYRASMDGIRDLVDLQRQILSCAQAYVKPGGVLLYSTCTVDPAENMENVRWFLEQYPGFRTDDIRPLLCPELRDSVEEEGCIQLLPGVHKSDGFFIARFVKETEETGKQEKPL